MRVFSHPDWFYEQFSELASRVSGAAELLDRVFTQPERAEESLDALTELDHAAAELRHQVITEIESVAVTPLPRENVHRVTSLLGDTVHRISDAAHRMRTLQPGTALPGASQLSGVLVRVAACIETTVASFRKRDYPTARCEDVERLGDEGRDIYARAIEELFAGHPDPMQVLRWKEVYDELERALDQCRDLDHALDGIVLDNRG